MNYQKLDPSLLMALNQVEEPNLPQLVVFIHTQQPLEASALDMLANLGISDNTSQKDVFTATLSTVSLSQLTEQSWVKYVKLSQKLHLRNSPFS
ncbi:hypothetical protein [Calothrix sp. NIES-3974]|uniref:hypothetical protein n=1 Tax=Calothrix sp. NIES-3974 TaxID=2005462 RepID=UPI000BBC3302|nr:hypothetical protein [Calothrix sp. NIES-3974]